MNTSYARSCIIIQFPLGATIKGPPSKEKNKKKKESVSTHFEPLASAAFPLPDLEVILACLEAPDVGRLP